MFFSCKIFALLCITIISVRCHHARVCMNTKIASNLPNSSARVLLAHRERTNLKNDRKHKNNKLLISEKKKNIGREHSYYFTKEKKEILNKKKKKKFVLNYSKLWATENEKRKNKKLRYPLFFIKHSTTSLNEIKESIKALFNLDYIENNYIYSYIKAFKRTPPITKLYLISTLLLSICIHLNKNVYKLILFDFKKIFHEWQVWRLLTPYLYIGNLYLQYFLMFNYLHIYMSSVEIAHYKNPEDLLIFITFGYLSNLLFTIIGSMYNENIMNMQKYIKTIRNIILKGANANQQKIEININKEHYNHLGYVFSTYILYYWSRINEGTLINCFELFLIKAEYVPFFFIIQNVLLYNEFSFYEVASIMSSYFFFTYENYFKLDFIRRFNRALLKSLRVYPMYETYKEEYE